MTKTSWNILALGALVATGATSALYGCGGPAKPADTAGAPSDSAALPEPSPLASTTPADSASAAPDDKPLAQILLTDPAQVQKLFDAAASAPAATMKQNGATGTDALAKGIRDAAKKLPAGMQPEGAMAMGSIKEKQHLQTDVTLNPDKCYSIVGYSKKVKDLDLYLFLPPGLLRGQDLTDDNKPIIGGAPEPMCPDRTMTYKLDIFADSGGGDVAVQLFSKGK